MSSTVNRVILVGHVGKDPKIHDGTTKVAKFSLATSEKARGEEITEWHNLVAFGKTAEIVEKYVEKGKQLYVEGRIKTNSWEDKETGQKRSRVEIMVDRLVLLGSKGEPKKVKDETFDDEAPPF